MEKLIQNYYLRKKLTRINFPDSKLVPLYLVAEKNDKLKNLIKISNRTKICCIENFRTRKILFQGYYCHDRFECIYNKHDRCLINSYKNTYGNPMDRDPDFLFKVAIEFSTLEIFKFLTENEVWKDEDNILFTAVYACKNLPVFKFMHENNMIHDKYNIRSYNYERIMK